MTDPERSMSPVPLPTDLKTEWPPPHLKGMYGDIVIADAWWSDDPDKLKAVYSTPEASARVGVRSFWSKPAPTTKADQRIHVPLASDIAQTGADLIFGDEIAWTVPEAHDANPDDPAAATTAAEALKAEQILGDLSDDINLAATLLEAAEIAGGLSGVYLRPTWDKSVSDKPLLHVIHPDRAVPEFAWGQMRAVTFWTDLPAPGKPDGTVWRHLERHEPGLMLNGLYAGSATHLGIRRPLADHPSTAGMVDELNLAQLLQWPGLFAFYVPNVKPNRKRREIPVGRPDTMGSESLMDALDRTVTSLMRDIDLGKARLIVPDDFLDRKGKGAGAVFDADREIFSPLDIDPQNADKAGITPIEFKIRTDEHLTAATALTETIIRKAGYSPQTFGMQGSGGDQTATEVDAREGASYRSTKKKRGYWRPELAKAGMALLAIDRHVFKRPVLVVRPQIELPELGQEDAGSLASTVAMLKNAQAASIETRVRMVNPTWDKPQIDAEVERIKAEEAIVVDDPTGGFT